MDENLHLLLQAIQSDWALVDEKDSDKHYILVNNDRDEHPDLKPLKSYIKELELEDLIAFEPNKSDALDKVREYSEFFGEISPVPFVYFYKLTEKGGKYT
jgi:hypothetical protein